MNDVLGKLPELPRASSNLIRWKRVTGASAAIGAVAAAGSVSARTVQITLLTEQATASNVGGSNTFTGDFTRDNINDVPLWSGTYIPSNSAYLSSTFGRVGFASYAGVTAGGNFALGNPRSISALIPFVFTDFRINGGAATGAFLEVNASNGPTAGTVRAVRTVFDDASINRPTGVIAGGTNTEFDPTVYAQRTKFANKIKKLKKKAKAAARAGNPIKAKKLNKKVKKLNKRLAAIS